MSEESRQIFHKEEFRIIYIFNFFIFIYIFLFKDKNLAPHLSAQVMHSNFYL